jgi:hypothetical protein
MEIRAYNGFVVLVRAIAPMPERLIRTSFVSISAQDNREHLASLYSTLEFPNDKDAEAYGFTMAEKWIHSRLPPLHQHRINVRPLALPVSTQGRTIG